MPKQPAFPGLRDAMQKKQTRRALFLSEMDAVVPWVRLLALIAPHYPTAGGSGTPQLQPCSKPCFPTPWPGMPCHPTNLPCTPTVAGR